MRPQHTEFLRHYISCWNGTEAAKKAGYSPHTAASQAARLLKRDDIQAELAELQQVQHTDLAVPLPEFIEICSKRLRAGGRDAGRWGELLMKARGWAAESIRIEATLLPPPIFAAPDEIPGLPPTLLPGCNSVAAEFSDVPKVLESQGKIG